MNPNLPQATHVAVREGRILGIGTLDELKGWGDYQLDTIFADKLLMPGLIEGHAPAFAGALWAYPYVGSHDRIGPEGRLWKGCRNVEEVVLRLKQTEATLTDPDEPVLAWGLDPIYFVGPAMTAADPNIEGVIKGPDGQPIGELREMAAMFFAFKVAGGNLFLDEKPAPEGVWILAVWHK